ncbi:MAG: hypothetical protein IT449_01565 [Phycisphaerales bacterium]|nr:hypothetical protein [Phycisphaerales bacterium]
MILTGLISFALLALTQIPGAETPADRFLAALAQRQDVDPATREFIANQWSQSTDKDGNAFLAGALSVLSPQFRKGLEQYEAEDHAACAATMKPLADNPDPFLAANARFYYLKALVAQKNFAAALGELEAIAPDRHARIEPYSYHLPELDFLHAYSLVENLRYEEASRHLVQFLTVHPDAPQRLIVSARQMLAELANRQPGRIGEVSDLMMFAANRLGHRDTGADVQERQKRAMELLDKLIKEAEDREKNQSKNPNNGGSPQNQNRPQPQNPMQQSQLPPGAAGQANLRVRQASPGEAWGALAPQDREKILQALKESFPGKYRRLVEQYYEQLAKEP